LLAGVIAAVTHLGEIEHFAKLARDAKPKWLLVALLLQFGTYVCTAAVWNRALHYVNIQKSFFLSYRLLLPNYSQTRPCQAAERAGSVSLLQL